MTSISSAMSTALSGMLAQQTKAAATASNVANADTPGYKRLQTTMSASGTGGVSANVAPSGASDGDNDVDLATEMLNMAQASQAYKANADVWETGADMWDALASVVR